MHDRLIGHNSYWSIPCPTIANTAAQAPLQYQVLQVILVSGTQMVRTKGGIAHMRVARRVGIHVSTAVQAVRQYLVLRQMRVKTIRMARIEATIVQCVDLSHYLDTNRSVMSTPQPPISVQGLTFNHVLTATDVENEHDDNGAVVRYDIMHPNVDGLIKGVYVVTANDSIVYVGKFTGTFEKRWLYTKLSKIYHHKRNAIAASRRAGSSVHVYAQTEDELRRQIPAAETDTAMWINVGGIEAALIRTLAPAWNSAGA